MKILIIEGPGNHPESYARALGGALHQLGHVAIVHPLRKTLGSWGVKHYVGRESKKILETHRPDIIHVVSSEPWIAETFTGKGVPVVHSTEDSPSKSDWVVVPTKVALIKAAALATGLERRISSLPYAVEISEEERSYGEYLLAAIDPGDKVAVDWVEMAAMDHPFVPVQLEGDPAHARAVISVSSRRPAWLPGLAEAMAAGRPVLASWIGLAPEFVIEGVSGFLSAPGDIKSLGSHLEYLWDRPEEAYQMGAEARRSAREYFGATKHARALLRLYMRAGASRLAV